MNVPVALRRLWIQLTADRRRFGLFCVMLGVGLLLWARLIVITNTPRTVVADDKSQQAAQTAGPVELSSPSPSTTSAVRAPAKPPLRVVLATSPQRDPFVISNEHFPGGAGETTPTADQGKSPSNRAEDFEQVRYAQLKRLAESLKLEAIMSPGGGQPLVVINARTYQLNEDVPATGDGSSGKPVQFRLLRVGERSATLECEGHRFERTLPGVVQK